MRLKMHSKVLAALSAYTADVSLFHSPSSAALHGSNSTHEKAAKSRGEKSLGWISSVKTIKQVQRKKCVFMVLSQTHRQTYTGQKFCLPHKKAVWVGGELYWGQRSLKSWKFSLWFCWWRIQKVVKFLILQIPPHSGLPAHNTSWIKESLKLGKISTITKCKR